MTATFLAAAKTRGLAIDRVITDGVIHRVPVEGKGKSNLSGWYVLSAPTGARMFGAYGRWDDGLDADTWHDGDAAKPLNRVELAAMAEARANAAKLRDEDHAATAKAVQSYWDGLTLEGASPYLKRKGVEAHGVRFDGEAIVIPLRDENNALWSFQKVQPDGTKRFKSGGKIAGCFHLIGAALETAETTGATVSIVLIAEGYATAATLHEATGAPVACAMNCGNLLATATALRKRYPNAKLIICADDDAATEAKTGANAGVKAAQEAATKLQCAWVKPIGLAAGMTDFNDLAQSQGLGVVKAQLQAAIDAATAAQTTGGATATLNNANSPNSASKIGKATSTGAARKDSSLPRFDVNDSGVWWHGVDKENNAAAPVWVCSALRVTAHTRDGTDSAWGYLLEFADKAGNHHVWAMPAAMLAGDGNGYRGELLALGLSIGTSMVSRERLTFFIQTSTTQTLARCTDKIGWHEGVFVLPDGQIGESKERWIFQSGTASTNPFKQAGTIADWQTKVGALCAGNSRLTFAVSAALAGCTLDVTGMESGGFHYRGNSSTGKTSALRVAASVLGGKDYMQKWRTTDNALEGMAAQYSDTVLILDEIGTMDGKIVGEAAYMLANGAGKSRSSKTGALKQSLTWRLLFLSSGETSLNEHMEASGKRTRAGQETRLPDIPADAGHGMGLFEALHGIEGGATFANTLNAATLKYHGVIGRLFIEHLAAQRDVAKLFIKERVNTFINSVCKVNDDGQVRRVAARFAQVGAAGELATFWGLTGWLEGEATRGAKTCFYAWLKSRGGTGNSEERHMINQVRECLERYGENRFTDYRRAEKDDTHAPDTVNRLGFKRRVNEEDGSPFEFYVLPMAFEKDLCKGFNAKDVAKVLKARGFLSANKGNGVTKSQRLPGFSGTTRVYNITPAIFEYDDEDDLDTPDSPATPPSKPSHRIASNEGEAMPLRDAA